MQNIALDPEFLKLRLGHHNGRESGLNIVDEAGGGFGDGERFEEGEGGGLLGGGSAGVDGCEDPGGFGGDGADWVDGTVPGGDSGVEGAEARVDVVYCGYYCGTVCEDSAQDGE